MAVQTYVMESMAYMTSGIMDTYEEADAAVEAAMVKVGIHSRFTVVRTYFSAVQMS